MSDGIKIFGIILMVLAIMYMVVSAAWWVILWSFNFPIAFAWKQTIGVMVATMLLNSSAAKS